VSLQVIRSSSSTLKLGDEEDFAAFADRLEIGGLVERAVDRYSGFFDEVFAEAGVEAVHFLDDAAQILGLDREFAHAAGVAAAEPAGEDNPRGHVGSFLPQSLTHQPLSRIAGEGADPRIAVRGEAGEGSSPHN